MELRSAAKMRVSVLASINQRQQPKTVLMAGTIGLGNACATPLKHPKLNPAGQVSQNVKVCFYCEKSLNIIDALSSSRLSPTSKQSVMPSLRRQISACFLSPFVKTYLGYGMLFRIRRRSSSFCKSRSRGSEWCTKACHSS